MKKPKVGEKLHVPRIGVCRIVSVHGLHCSVLVKRGRRRFFISKEILHQLRQPHRFADYVRACQALSPSFWVYRTVFEGWDRPRSVQGIIVTQPRFSYWRMSPERGEPWECEGRRPSPERVVQ